MRLPKGMKPVSALAPADLRRHPVWEFATDFEELTGDETVVRPYDDLLIDDFDNRIVGTVGTLANGDRVPIILTNIDLESPYKTEHFVGITVFNRANKQFPLARYHDIGRDRYGPDQLAEFMGLSVHDIFAIAYDISDVALADHDSVRGELPVAPRRPLSRAEIIRMAVQSAGEYVRRNS